MYTARIFRSKDCTRETLWQTYIYTEKFSLFKNLFIKKRLFNFDIEVYEGDTLIFVGCVGHFLNRMLDEFKEEISKELN